MSQIAECILQPYDAQFWHHELTTQNPEKGAKETIMLIIIAYADILNILNRNWDKVYRASQYPHNEGYYQQLWGFRNHLENLLNVGHVLLTSKQPAR